MSAKDEEQYHPHYEGAGRQQVPHLDYSNKNQPLTDTTTQRMKRKSPLVGIAIVAAMLLGLAVLFFILH